MRVAVIVLIGAAAWLTAAVAVLVTVNLAARVATYCAYHRRYPAVPRATVWRHISHTTS